MALGTDINGLAPQIEVNGTDPQLEFYPNGGYVDLRGTPLRVMHPETHALAEVRFKDRGIATYGMLPDFMGAVAGVPIDGGTAPTVVDRLYRSSEAVIQQWEAQERAACLAFG